MKGTPDQITATKTCLQSSDKKRVRGFLLWLALLPFVLAVWQYQRGSDKQHWEAALQQAAQQAAQPLIARDLQAVPDYRRVSLSGLSLQGQPVLLGNSLLNEQPGSRVLQVARLADGSHVLLDLGWLADGQAMPSIRPDRFDGQWLPWSPRFVLPGALHGVQGRVDALDVPALQTAWPGRWRKGVVLLQPPLNGLKRWPVQPPLSSNQHYAYALQWALMGGCLLWLALYRRSRS